MKYGIIFIAIIGLIVFAWLLGAMPSDEELQQGQMLKIDKELQRYER